MKGTIYGYKIVEDNKVKVLKLPKTVIKFLENVDTFEEGNNVTFEDVLSWVESKRYIICGERILTTEGFAFLQGYLQNHELKFIGIDKYNTIEEEKVYYEKEYHELKEKVKELEEKVKKKKWFH